ncbi:MAG: hypothetical protein BroJett018_49140 [Chloroflexota bacterium]|nr:MAG: hypothetical protein BroJett018_49140 [Chloroflexota bacterium]
MILVEKIKIYRNSIQIDVPMSVKTYAHHVVLEENDVRNFCSHDNQILHPADRLRRGWPCAIPQNNRGGHGDPPLQTRSGKGSSKTYPVADRERKWSFVGT